MKRVEIEGREYVAADSADGSICRRCEFRKSEFICDQNSPERKACRDYSLILTPENYIKLKLKGEVL